MVVVQFQSNTICKGNSTHIKWDGTGTIPKQYTICKGNSTKWDKLRHIIVA